MRLLLLACVALAARACAQLADGQADAMDRMLMARSCVDEAAETLEAVAEAQADGHGGAPAGAVVGGRALFFFADGQWWLTVASDHTDRRVEAYSVTVSKQMCAKPVAGVAWRWADVAPYQDELLLSSRILEDGRWVDYQRGTLAAIRPLAALREGFFGSGGEPGGFMTCGTLPALPGPGAAAVRPAAAMELSLHDPRRGLSIVHRYAVQVLEIVA